MAVQKLGRSGALVLGLLVVDLGNLLAAPVRGLRDLIDSDYLDDAVAAWILRSGSRCVYCPRIEHAAEESFLGLTLPPGQQSGYLHPPLTALVLEPLTYLSPEAGLAVFLGVSLLSLLASNVILVRSLLPAGLDRRQRVAVAMVTTCTFPAAWGVALGQWGPVILLGVVAGMATLRRGRPVIAGILLSVALLKPQLLLLVPSVLALIGAWRVLLGSAFGAALWGASSLLILGFDHLPDLAGRLRENYYGETTPMMGIPGLVRGFAGVRSSLTLWAAAVASLLAVLLACRLRGALRTDPSAAVAWGVAVSLVCAPHVWAHDLILLAPALLVGTRTGIRGAVVAGAALDVAYVIDQALPRPQSPLLSLAALAIVAGYTRGLAAYHRRFSAAC